MKFHLLMHIDGGNRGCEAITKATAILLKEHASNIFAYSRNITLDTFLGTSISCTIINIKRGFLYKVIRKLLLLSIKSSKMRMYITHHSFVTHMKKIHSDEVYLSSGGDMMCYGDNEAIFTNNFLHKRGIKTILWGCSMGKENATPAKIDTLMKYSAVYARESLSYEFFKSLNLKNVILLPDPAFILQPQSCEVPSVFNNNQVVGINVSNYILKNDSLESDKGKQVLQLVEYILKNTNYHILLIPHVFWKEQNDIVVCHKVMDAFGANPRMSILNSQSLNYCEIRYVISKCKFFVGARTHSVISAYSMCVPTIALGYSIKARGIAKDIGLPDRLVVDFSKNLQKSVLLDSFKYLEENENQIRAILEQNIFPYKKKLENFDFKAWIGGL